MDCHVDSQLPSAIYRLRNNKVSIVSSFAQGFQLCNFLRVALNTLFSKYKKSILALARQIFDDDVQLL